MRYLKVRWTNAGINFIHNYPPAPPGFAPNNFPHPSFCPGAGICWDSSRGAGICQETIFTIFGISIIMARTGDWQHFGVYLLIKDWECETVLLSGIWFREYSGKSVCINNHITEFVLLCWQLICGCQVFNNYKNSNYKKTWKESIKIRNIFL